MTVLTFVALLAGVVLLVAGAELLVRGAVAVASGLGVAPIVIGLTVVAFGTSAPELAVSIGASLGGQTDVAVGNVVGSNVANILLILGLSAVVGGLVVSSRIVRLDVPLLIVVSVVTFLMALDGSIGRIDGVILFAAVLVYTGWLIRSARRGDSPAVEAEFAEEVDELDDLVERPLVVQLGLVVVGVALLVGGSQLLVGGATDIAEELGVSDLVIGLTVVAIGTSLPELATSVMAAIRGERDIAVGNIVGSNLFNLMSVLGLTSAVTSGGIEVIDASLEVDFPVMLAATVVLLPVVWRGGRIERWEGVVFIVGYLAYVTYLVLDASDSGAAETVGAVAPLAGGLAMIGFTLLALRGWLDQRRS